MELIKFTFGIILIVLFFSSCNKKEFQSWNQQGLKNVPSLSTKESGDTIIVKYYESSYLFFEEYIKWKTDYLIWLNRELLQKTKVYKIISYQPIRDDITYFYEFKDIQEVIELYSSNLEFTKISHVILDSLSNSEILGLLKVNNSMNDHYPEYNESFSDLFYEATRCQDTCTVGLKLYVIGEFIYWEELEYFWDKEIKVDPCRVVKLINTILANSIYDEIKLKPICQFGLLDKTIADVEYFKIGDKEKIKNRFFSTKFFNEISNSSYFIEHVKEQMETYNYVKNELIHVNHRTIKADNRFWQKDSMDVISTFIPLFKDKKSNDYERALLLYYTLIEENYNLVGMYIFDPLKSNEIPNLKSI